MRSIKKVRKRVFAGILAAAMIFTTPGMTSFAEAGGAYSEDISENSTAQEDDVDAANSLEEPEKPEAGESDTEEAETAESDTEEAETAESDTEEAEAAENDTDESEAADSDADESEKRSEDAGAEDAVGEVMAALDEAVAPEPAFNTDSLAPVSRLYVLGNEVVNGSVTSGNGWSYDKETNTLTLDNLTVTADDYPENVTKFLDLGASANGRCLLNVYLKGNNTINSISEDEFIFYRTYLALNITGDDDASLTLNGMVQSDIRLISGNINFTINTQGPIFINYGMSIDDGATVVFNCSYGETWKAAYYSVLSQGKGGIFVKNNSTLEINATNPSHQCSLMGCGPLTVEDSTLTLKNVYATGVGTYFVNPWSGAVEAEDTVTIKNSTVNLDTVEGLRGYSIDIANSTINTVEKTALALRSMGGDVALTDTELNGLILESGTTLKYTVSGKFNRPTDFTLTDGRSLTIPEGASLNIPDSVTLTNNGTMRIHDRNSLTGAGTLAGTGSFLIDVTEDLISIPESLACTGTDYADQIKLEETVTVCGIEFSAGLDADEWTRSISPSEAVVDAGEYTVTFTKGDESISKTFTVAQSGTDLTGEGKIQTYNGETETRDFTVSDTITVIATPAADTGVATQKAARLWGGSFTSPTAGQMALFVNGFQVSEPVNVGENGAYTMTAGASDVLTLGHVEPNGTAIPLTVKFVGNSAMAGAAAAVEINISAAVKVNSYGTTTYYDTFDDAWMAAEDAGTATVTLLTDVAEKNFFLVSSGKKFTINGGSHTLSIIGINLDGGQLDIIGGTFEMREPLRVLSGTVRLSGGEFISTGDGEIISCEPGSNLTVGDFLLNHGSTDSDATHYAYFTEEGKPLIGVLEQMKLTGTVIVQECRHDAEGVGKYQHNEGTQTHTLTCLACGYTEAEADCDYGTEYKHDETGHTKTCKLCGTEKTEAHNFAKLTAEVSGTVIKVSGVCACEYEEELGSVTLTIPQDLVYGEPLDKPITWETDLELYNGWLIVRLDSGPEKEYSGSFFLSELPDQREQWSAGNHTLGVVVEMTEDMRNPRYVECSIPFTVERAVLTPSIDASGDTPTKTYDGTTDAPDGLVIKLEGIVDDDDVSAAAASYEYDSADAGARIIYANGITLSGDDAGNYELSGDTAQIDGTIDKAAGTLTVPETSFSKKYGEPDFSLQCSTNGDGEISYVSDNEAVVTVSAEGMVQLKGLGEVTVTVALAESKNYTAAAARTVTIIVDMGENAPNMPDSIMNVPNSYLKVSDVPLAKNWEWREEDRDKALKEETAVEAVAVYTGTDKDNFENVTVTVAVTSHEAGTDIFYTSEGEKEPTCTETGLGHKECITCHAVVQSGIIVEALGHDYKGVVTKEPTTSEEGEMTYTCSRCGDTYTEPITNKIPEGLWISGLAQSVPYTGSAIKPEGIRVYHGSTLLREKMEYTISYKNNIKAGTAQLIVTGKGSYKGKATADFTIEPVDLSATDSGISATIATAAETGKNLKPAVTVTWNGKKLKEKTDYTLTYEEGIKSASEAGYDVTISGKGNYSGVIVKKFRVAPKGTLLLNKATVKGLKKSYEYDRDIQNSEKNGGQSVNVKGLEADLANITVKIGTTTLTKDTDYTVRTESTDAVGTGYVVIEATQTGTYAGEKRIPFNITGTNIKKCFITGLTKSYPYTGEPIMPGISVYTGKNGTGTQIPIDSYTVQYSNYTNQGKATVTVTGIPEKGCLGSVKAAYNIGKLNLVTEKEAGSITVTMPDDIKYAKGGAKPQPEIIHSYNGTDRTLREGVDYTLKYSNNTTQYSSASPGSTKKPTLKITGIGNYSGTITENFDIAAQDIGKLDITVADKAYNSKKKGSYYYSVPKVYDLDGKQLKPNKDYTVQYTNETTAQPIGKTDTVENGTRIRVTATAKDNSCYDGTLSMTYLVREAKDVKDISKAKNDKIAAQQYTGSSIEPEVKLYIMNGKTKTYLTEEDYDIIGYYNNIKRGTATVLIRGTGAYSGVKSITFKIASADNKVIWSGIF